MSSGAWIAVGWLSFNLGLGIWFYVLSRRVPDEQDTLHNWLERDVLEGRISAEAYFAAVDKAKTHQSESLR